MRASLLACLAAAAACGDSDPAVPVDSAATADAPYDTATCQILGFYGDLGTKVGSTSLGPTTSTIVLDPGPPRDSFLLKLNTGKGVFAAGLATGTFTLAGADLDFSNCGACISIVADIGMMGPGKFYFATAGMLTLTATQPPAGSIQGVTFHEVTSAGAVVPGGCVARIDRMAFSTQ
ncbi:MAG: hypothetical protein JNL83_22075 [Myxococcales bacterium]|nr:hypothetical protein [Myxococcales bacterium]